MAYNTEKHKPIIEQYRKKTINELQELLKQSKEFVKKYEHRIRFQKIDEQIGMLKMIIAEKSGKPKRK